MNLIIKSDEYSINNVYFGSSVKNTVIEDGEFIRIFYSTSYMTLNVLYILFDDKTNINVNLIEENILKKFDVTGKTPKYKFEEYKKYSFGFNKINFLLKISGVWETKTEYGLIFKFITYFEN